MRREAGIIEDVAEVLHCLVVSANPLSQMLGNRSCLLLKRILTSAITRPAYWPSFLEQPG